MTDYKDPVQYLIPGTELMVSKSAIDIVNKAFENGEPVFVLRAKDFFALGTLKEYLRVVRTQGPTNPSYEQDIDKIVQGFEQWRSNHIGQVRYPD